MATARRFAATLGFIGFAFVGAFGLWQGAQIDWVLLRALIALVVFSVVGFIAGLIGAALVSDSADEELKRAIHGENDIRRAAHEDDVDGGPEIAQEETSVGMAAKSAPGDPTRVS